MYCVVENNNMFWSKFFFQEEKILKNELVRTNCKWSLNYDIAIDVMFDIDVVIVLLVNFISTTLSTIRASRFGRIRLLTWIHVDEASNATTMYVFTL